MGLFLRDLALLAILLAGLTFPNDDFESYPDGYLLTGLDGGTSWIGPYVVHGPGIAAMDDVETYADAAALNGLNNSGGGWSGSYADRVGLVGLHASDDLESYADTTALNGLNGGTSWIGAWSGAFVDR
jgi:hypothetical protein